MRPAEPAAPAPPRPRKRRLTRGRIVLLVVLLLLLLLVAWGVAGYLAFRSGVKEANERLPAPVREALDPHEGLLLSRPTVTLLLGTDHAATEDRADDRRTDSIMLVRTDPERHRISYLSIPRDLRVVIPGRGEAKINAAYQFGGAPLALETVRSVTKLPIHHVAIVNFESFREVIDAVGGIEVDVPAPIVSNKFECPYATQSQCDRWPGWRFSKGRHHLDGRRALVYARIRTNKLNPAESDFTRGERQQQVLEAIAGKLTSPRTLVKMPWIGEDLLKPVATDLSAGQFVQLAWLKFRSPDDRTLHCRLGGTAQAIGGQAVIVATEENVSVVNMFAGRSAPQPPLPGSGPFGPGCAVGRNTIG